MFATSAVCRLFLFYFLVNCLKQVLGGEDNDRAGFLLLVKNDPCDKEEVKNGDPGAVQLAAAECRNAFELFRVLPYNDQANCRSPSNPECAFTRGQNGWPRCSFDCDHPCSVKYTEKVGSGWRAKTKTYYKTEVHRKRYEISFIAERVKKPPRGTTPTILSGGAGPSGSGGGGAGGSGHGGGGGGSGPSGYGGGGYGGNVPYTGSAWIGDTHFTEGRWSMG